MIHSTSGARTTSALALKFILVMVFGTLMSGCSTTPPTIITKVERVYVTLPEAMVRPCVPARPIDSASYMALEVYDREREMTQYSISLLKTISQCNAQITGIKTLQGVTP